MYATETQVPTDPGWQRSRPRHRLGDRSSGRLRGGLSRRLSGERGAVGTEMAIVVAIVVAISIALGVVMTTSAQNHQECIPQSPGDTVPAGC